jgi:hypothetical protein
LSDFDGKYKATDKARGVDDRLGASKVATSAWNSISSYFDSGLNTQPGQKLRQFYDVGSKQVFDVHNEARHLANLKSGKPTSPPTSDAPVAHDSTAPAISAPSTAAIPLIDEKH